MAATKTKPTVASRIKKFYPCDEALTWATRYHSPLAAWKACKRGDWMLWLLGKFSGPPESEGRKKLVLCACECARLSLPSYQKKYPGDERVARCIETAERWANGEATIEELRTARAAAYSAAAAAYAAYSAAADGDAAYSAAADAAYSAAAAAYAAYSAAAAREETLAKCADIVRKHYPRPPK